MNFQPGWLPIVLGLFLAALALLWLLVPATPWLGRLPGGASYGKRSRNYAGKSSTCDNRSPLASGRRQSLRNPNSLSEVQPPALSSRTPVMPASRGGRFGRKLVHHCSRNCDPLAADGDCPNSRVSENGTVPFDAATRIPILSRATKGRGFIRWARQRRKLI